MSTNRFVENVSTLSFATITVSSRSFEFLNADPFSLTLPPTVSLIEGAVNNGVTFSINFTRTTGPGPLEQSGVIDFVITNTNSIDILSFPGTQTLIANFDIDAIEGTDYVSPRTGVFTIVGSSATSTSEVNYNYSIIIPGRGASTSAVEPGVLALASGGVIALGLTRSRRT